MRKIFMLLVACVAMVFVSCSKDDDGDNGTPLGGKQMSKITEYDENDEVSSYSIYEYDKQGRITKETWTDKTDGNASSATYIYGDKEIKIIEEDFDSEDGNSTYTTICKLNDKGFIVSSEDDNNHKYVYTYDNNDQLIKISGSDNITYTWENGNITKETASWGTFTYIYNQSENKNVGINYFSEDIPNDVLFNCGYFGAKNKNLMASRTSSAKYTYEYKFDKDGNVTEMKAYYINNGKKELDTKEVIEYK